MRSLFKLTVLLLIFVYAVPVSATVSPYVLVDTLSQIEAAVADTQTTLHTIVVEAFPEYEFTDAEIQKILGSFDVVLTDIVYAETFDVWDASEEVLIALLSFEKSHGLVRDSEFEKKFTDEITTFDKELTSLLSIYAAENGDLLFIDTDLDGLSDYSEKYFWNTDSTLAITNTKFPYTDGEQLLTRGIDPLTGEYLEITAGQIDVHNFLTVFVEEGDELIVSGRVLPYTVGALMHGEELLALVQADRMGYWNVSLGKDQEVNAEHVWIAQVIRGGTVLIGSTKDVLSEKKETPVVIDETERANESTGNAYATVAGFSVILLMLVLGIAIVKTNRSETNIDYQ